MIKKIDEMISTNLEWLKSYNYTYWGCNHVPESLFLNNKKWNTFIRTFYRLCPFNFRFGKQYPITPQANIILLKALSTSQSNLKLQYSILKRILALKSSKTKNFAIKQGVKISISLYEDSPEDPTPLNTVWFAQYLLDNDKCIFNDNQKKELLISISNYLVTELGFIDYKEKGIYFHYGHHISMVVYNASALISSLLIKIGVKYNISNYQILGSRGIKFIINNQNEDGSWFYAAYPARPTIDNFHQAYILEALIEVKNNLDFSVEKNIKKGCEFYKTMFIKKSDKFIPIRYDKRYTPRNTWLFVKTDGRDLAEAIIFFSKYMYDAQILEKLIEYTYEKFYNKEKGYFYPELFIYGKNRIPYFEFQSWFLYALNIAKQELD